MTDITTWLDEYHKGSRFGLNGKILIKKTSKYQEIIVIENEFVEEHAGDNIKKQTPKDFQRLWQIAKQKLKRKNS